MPHFKLTSIFIKQVFQIPLHLFVIYIREISEESCVFSFYSSSVFQDFSDADFSLSM